MGGNFGTQIVGQVVELSTAADQYKNAGSNFTFILFASSFQYDAVISDIIQTNKRSYTQGWRNNMAPHYSPKEFFRQIPMVLLAATEHTQ